MGRHIPARRTFSVKGQLEGKLGHDGLRQLLTALEQAARPDRKHRRRRPRRAA